MGNPAHLEELLKGVEHWNAWRKEQGDEFRPDFSKTDISQAFEDAGLLDKDRQIPLSKANLLGAYLVEAVLRGANLGHAYLRGATLRKADLRRAILVDADLVGVNLRDAILRGANLRGANLGGADLEGADLAEAKFGTANLTEANLKAANLAGAHLGGAYVRGTDITTIMSTAAVTNDIGTPKGPVVPTDLSRVGGLWQKQLGSMLGDSETIIPKDLDRPDWPTFEPAGENSDPERDIAEADQTHAHPEEPNNDADGSTGGTTQAPSMSRQVAFLLSVPEPAVASTIYVADLIDTAVSEAHAKSGQNRSDEGDAFLAVASQFRVLGAAIEQSASSEVDQKTKIAELEATIEAQMLEIDRLLNLLKSAKRTFTRDLIVGVLSSAGGAALYGGVGYLFGPEGANLIQYFWSILDPPAPPSPGPLPTTTAT